VTVASENPGFSNVWDRVDRMGAEESGYIMDRCLVASKGHSTTEPEMLMV
jgi:hypothetical protein